MSERKKHTNRLLVFMGLLFLLSFLPWNTLNAKAAVTLSRKKMILTVNQKQYLRVKGRPAGSTLIWRSSNTSVATVAGGTVRARRRGQIRGIKGMVENNAYCPDILIQSAAVNAAINAFNKELLANHIRTCVADDIRNGKDEAIDELVVTLQKLMK